MIAYLRANPPTVPQFRSPRRQALAPVIGVHTAESLLDTVGPDTGAENVARFIRTRTDPGSYHDVVDADSLVHLVDYGDEAFHMATHTLNRRTTSVSFACSTSDWARMTPGPRTRFLTNGAAAAAAQHTYRLARGLPGVPARRVTLAEALNGVGGFLAHADADPQRRSDPGADFPWTEFLTRYAALINSTLEKPMSAEEATRVINYVEAAALVTRASAAEHISRAATDLASRCARTLLVVVPTDDAGSPLGAIYAIAADHVAHVRPDEIEALLKTGAWMQATPSTPWTLTQVRAVAHHFGLDPDDAVALRHEVTTSDAERAQEAVRAATQDQADRLIAAVEQALTSMTGSPSDSVDPDEIRSIVRDIVAGARIQL